MQIQRPELSHILRQFSEGKLLTRTCLAPSKFDHFLQCKKLHKVESKTTEGMIPKQSQKRGRAQYLPLSFSIFFRNGPKKILKTSCLLLPTSGNPMYINISTFLAYFVCCLVSFSSKWRQGVRLELTSAHASMLSQPYLHFKQTLAVQICAVLFNSTCEHMYRWLKLNPFAVRLQNRNCSKSPVFPIPC